MKMQEEDKSYDEILELSEICHYQSKEFAQDMKLRDRLEQNQRKDLGKLIDDFNSVFSNEPGTTDLIKHEIKLTSMVPVRSEHYPVPYFVRNSQGKKK